MKIGKTPFAEVARIDDSIAEVIPFEGVEIGIEEVNQLDDWYLANLSAPRGLLINKLNAYSYTFEAQMKVGDAAEIKAVAVISYEELSKISSEILKQAPRKHKLNMEIFSTRAEGLRWLLNELTRF